jgi:DNA polymerase/3'-5' exonuclease PolX
MLPGLTAAQESALRRRKLTRKKLEERLRKYSEDDPVIASLPAAARAELAYKPEPKIPLAKAQVLAERLRERLAWPINRVLLVGSARRGKPEIKDLDILLLLPPGVSERRERTALDGLHLRANSGRLKILMSYSSGPRRRSAIVRYNGANYRTDFFLARHEERPYALFHHTGSSRYNIRIRAHAKEKGWLLNQYGLFNRKSMRRVRGTESLRTEEELAKFLGVTYRLPEDRQR